MGVKIKQSLNAQNILSKISEYDIFRHYCKHFKEMHTLFISELREDNNPTCSIYVGKNNNLIYKDWNGGIYNCFSYIIEKYAVNYNTALNMINRDFNLQLKSTWKIDPNIIPKDAVSKTFDNKKVYKKEHSQIKIKIRNYDKKDKEYWGKYNITIKTLKKFKVIPLECFWIDNYIYREKLSYSYEFGDQKRKIYSPMKKKKGKWFSNTNPTIIQGYKQILTFNLLKDVIYIVSSLKEVMFFYEQGYDAIAFQSENHIPTSEIVDYLKKTYEKVIIFYDFDRAGIIQSLLLERRLLDENVNVERKLFCPVLITTSFENSKDLTDLYAKNKEKALQLID